MQLGHPQEALTNALIDALGHRLPDIEYQDRTWMERRDGSPGVTKTRRPVMADVEVRMFPETWGSTALGFGGIGGSAMTAAYTVIVICEPHAAVYWAGGFAYMIEVGEAFMNDVNSGRTVERSKAGKYRRAA
jgi:predicted phage tail protein